MIFDNPICHPTVMFRRKVIDNGWKYNNIYVEDHDLWTRMLPTVKFSNIGEKLLLYRQYDGNTSFQGSRLSMALIVADTTKQYVKKLFSLDTEPFFIEDFAKNYYLYFFYKEIGSDITEYFLRQFSLLTQIYLQNEKKHSTDSQALASALNRRWINIMGLADYLLPKLADLYASLASASFKATFFADEMARFYDCNVPDYRDIFEKFQNDLRMNEILLKENFSEKKNFLMYGMGEQGRIMLEKYEKLKTEGICSWNLIGIVDRRPLTVTCMGQSFHSISKDQIRDMDFDYILVSSLWYFNDIKQELAQLGIDEHSIIRGGGLYLYEKM